MLTTARELPAWRSRQLAAWLTDHRGLAVSASTVYRILRREGLVKSPEMQMKAGKEYHRKTNRPSPDAGQHRLSPDLHSTPDLSDLKVSHVCWLPTVTYYNYSRYHMALSNVTPADVLNGRREQILQRRKEVQLQTIDRRRRYNRTVRELAFSSS